MKIETVITGPIQENCFLVVDEKQKSGFVIDPGWDAAKIKRALDRMGIVEVTILCTHGHLDHISGVNDLRKLTGAKAFMSEKDFWLIPSVLPDHARMFGMPGTDIFEMDGSIEPGQVFKTGEISLTALPTPGHSPGGMSFYDGGSHVYVGDALFAGSVGRVDFPQSSGRDLLKSIIEVLYKLPDSTIVHCGHGPDTTIGQEKKYNYFTNNPDALIG